MNSDETHPELRENEVFLGNYAKEDIRHLKWWNTLRTGLIAYNDKGEVIPDHVPSFVQEEEWIEMNRDKSEEWNEV